ncbi:nucleotidyltransferase domain-containing protein [Tepidibacter sp. Z1-5]|uniref:nucleotidyltransferase domain-containing protein n=1 Tax=Tepidibacter sp. Z1-5 TaxID=3134138 RepID=UPI0030C3BB39
MDIKQVYEELVLKLKKNQNNIAIIVVGSSVDLNFNKNINDIDLFIITQQGDKQIRKRYNIQNVEFDINYFSENLAYELIKKKELFFIEGIIKGNNIYDKKNILDDIKKYAESEYNKGPLTYGLCEIKELKFNITDNIKRIKNSEDLAYIHFMSNLCLKKILKSYFIVNNKWVPKDKKLFQKIKEEDYNLYNLFQNLYMSYDFNVLNAMVEYVFKNIK